MTTDPEYDRLRDAVVDAAMGADGWSALGSEGMAKLQTFKDAKEALRDYRTKSTSPAPTCNDSLQVRGQPDSLPDAAEGCPACGALPCDWVNDPRSTPPDPVPLLPCPFCGGEAKFERKGDHRRSTIVLCEDCGCMLENGEEWDHGIGWNTRHSPCKPDTRIEPTDEAIQLHDGAGHIRAMVKSLSVRVIETFCGLPFQAAAENALQWADEVDPETDAPRFSPTQPAPVQREIGDGEIDNLAFVTGIASEGDDAHYMRRVNKFARTLLSKHTPTITKDQWEQIRKLAISDAPESFPYGVAKVLGI